MFSLTNAGQLVDVFMSSRLDDCNAVLGVCPALLINNSSESKTQPLQISPEPGRLTILARFCQRLLHCWLLAA